MKVSVVGVAVDFVGDVVADGVHLLAAHTFPEMCRYVIGVCGFHDIGKRHFILPLKLSLERQNVVHKSVLKPAWRLAELDAFA